MNKKGIMLTITSALLYGFTPVLCFLTYGMGNNPITLTFFRNFFVIPVLAVIMLIKRIDFCVSRKEFFNLVIVGLFGAVLTTLLLYSSYRYVGVGTATTLHFLYPVFVALFCKFVYHDTITKPQIRALFLAVLGILFFIDLKDLGNLQGMLMALISGVTFAIYLVLIDKTKLSHMNGFKLSFYLACVVFTTLLVGNLAFQFLVFDQPLASFGLMFCVAVLASFVAVICLKEGIRLLGSNLASLFCLFEPISSLIFGVIFLHETLTLPKLLGSGIIVTAIWMLSRKQ